MVRNTKILIVINTKNINILTKWQASHTCKDEIVIIIFVLPVTKAAERKRK